MGLMSYTIREHDGSVNPAKIDLIVPPAFRKGSAISPVLRLHCADIGPSEIEIIEGVPATKALHTALDVWQEGSLPGSSLRSAFAEASRFGNPNYATTHLWLAHYDSSTGVSQMHCKNPSWLATSTRCRPSLSLSAGGSSFMRAATRKRSVS
jgi:hypothetical protein